MNLPDSHYVYHGSDELFEVVIPKRQRRSKKGENGEQEIIFDEVSFHATPYRWIALAYTCTYKPHVIDGLTSSYKMGVSLYDHYEEISVYGFNSLEETLDKLYGDGGYLFTFDKKDFFHTKGLGNLEVITKESVRLVKVERIDDPVAELKKLGITFRFEDLSKPEHVDLR